MHCVLLETDEIYHIKLIYRIRLVDVERSKVAFGSISIFSNVRNLYGGNAWNIIFFTTLKLPLSIRNIDSARKKTSLFSLSTNRMLGVAMTT